MKKVVIFLFLFTFSNLYASEIKLEKIIGKLNKPWSLSFIDDENIILTEKNGKIFSLNIKSKVIKGNFLDKF